MKDRKVQSYSKLLYPWEARFAIGWTRLSACNRNPPWKSSSPLSCVKHWPRSGQIQMLIIACDFIPIWVWHTSAKFCPPGLQTITGFPEKSRKVTLCHQDVNVHLITSHHFAPFLCHVWRVNIPAPQPNLGDLLSLLEQVLGRTWLALSF